MHLEPILAMFGQRRSTFYLLNDSILVIGFFLVRIVVIPFAWIQMFKNKNDILDIGGSGLFYFAIVICILCDMQNIYWFMRMLGGFMNSAANFFMSLLFAGFRRR